MIPDGQREHFILVSTDAERVDGTVVPALEVAIALGTLFGGWRIVRTMGQHITKLKPVGGFAAETGGAMSLLLASGWLF